MLSVGEQSNRLPAVLLKLADKLEARAQQKLDVLLRLLEPALMLVMAVVVGFMVIALLMPVFEGSGLA
jgi:type II secretory pathway component PulF